MSKKNVKILFETIIETTVLEKYTINTLIKSPTCMNGENEDK